MHVAQVMGKGNKIHIDCQQHQFDCHQQDNQVFPVEEYSHNRYGKQNRTK
jgi:hypothetical protein